MGDDDSFPLAEVLGFMTTGPQVRIGLRADDGRKLALSADQNQLYELIESLIAATAAYPLQKIVGKNLRAWPPDWFEVGRAEGSTDTALTFRIFEGGHVTFLLSHEMSRQLSQTLNVMHGAASSIPEAGSPAH